MPKTTSPRWAVFEKQVFEHFKEYFPAAKVRRNVRVKGRFSKRHRQIDILVTEVTPAGIRKTVVDTKLLKRKVDVKAVDGLAGFVEDVGADRGMLITDRGYTRAALRRAYYGPSDLELDILNFSALAQHQGFAAIPYVGPRGYLVGAPFGWIIDATRTEGRLANMYQRGLDLAGAMRKKEFLYVNSWDRGQDRITAAELDERQVAGMRLVLGAITVSHRETVSRLDAPTRLRVAEVKRYRCLEVTGFVEFKESIFFAVLLTPVETQRSNIRRLESVLRDVRPITLKFDNSVSIGKIQGRLKEVVPPTERPRLLGELGRLYREAGKFNEALEYLEESLALDPNNSYHTIRELLPVLCNLGHRDRAKQVMAYLLRLDSGNPTVFNDCVSFASAWIDATELVSLFDDLMADRPNDQLVRANCDFYAGQVLLSRDLGMARQRLLAARQAFRAILPRGHQIFGELRRGLQLCSRSTERSASER